MVGTSAVVGGRALLRFAGRLASVAVVVRSIEDGLVDDGDIGSEAERTSSSRDGDEMTEEWGRQAGIIEGERERPNPLSPPPTTPPLPGGGGIPRGPSCRP